MKSPNNEKILSMKNEPIAIIGMGCRFPGGAMNYAQFWQNLKDGKDCITEIPPDRFNADYFYSANKNKAGRIHTRWGGYIDGIAEFDPVFFGLTPYEASYMDPQHRKLLEVTWEALEDGCQKPGALAGKEIGVFIGAFTVDYKILQFGGLNYDNIAGHTATGIMMTMVANRISHTFDFRGPSVSLDTACSSSLVAVHLACRSLLNGECMMAVAGGTLLHCTPQYTIAESKGGFLSPTGWSHTFDSSANGYVRAEGVGVMILKRLKDALRDNDPIHALIIGSGVNQDGHTQGITVPNPRAQMDLISRVYAEAGITAGDIQYMEAHGTGTPVGDPLEANAIGEILEQNKKPGCKYYVGSVKTNIGHTESAAGVAGLMKAVLCMKHKQIAPHLHLKQVNPKIHMDKWSFEIPAKLVPWPDHDGLARAGVNSFGFGGTNAHVILQEAPAQSGYMKKHPVLLPEQHSRARIFTLTTRDDEVFRPMIRKYRDFIEQEEGVSCSLDDINYTVNGHKEHLEERLSIIYRSKEELLAKMDAYLNSESDPLILKNTKWQDGKHGLVWVFTGMGPQWWAMGRQLYEKEPVFRDMIDRCDREMSKYTDWSLKAELIDAPEDKSRMEETWLSQPCNFAVQIGLAALWRSWGIKPSAIVGHSTGEAAAFYEAGVYTFADACRIIIQRSRLQQKQSGTGKMAAVGISEAEALVLIASCKDKISVAAINSARTVTLSGNEEALNEIIAPLKEKGIFTSMLRVQIPFHSVYMDPVREELLAELKSIAPRKAVTPLYSTVFGRQAQGDELDAAYWWDNVRGSVRFYAALNAILEDGYSLFLEVGPHPVLANSITECFADKHISGKVLPSLRRRESEQERMLMTLAEFHNIGLPVDWKALNTGRAFIRMPSYPWKTERYWVSAGKSEHMRFGSVMHPLFGHRMWAPDAWETEMDLEKLPYLQDHKIQGTVVFPAAGYIEMALSVLDKTCGSSVYSLDNLEIQKALFLSENEPPVVQFHLDRDKSTFKILSYDDVKNETTAIHAQGVVRALQNVQITEPVDFEHIRKNIGPEWAISDCYGKLALLGYHYGPHFQAMQKVWIGKREALACIRLNEPGSPDADEYYFHPALLDACFQTLITPEITNESGEETTGIRIPVSIEQIRITVKGIRELYAHAVIHQRDNEKTIGDIILYTPDGRAVGEIRGFLARGTEVASGNIAAATLDNWIYEIEWIEKEIPVSEDKEEKSYSRYKGNGWMIFSDRKGRGDALAESIRANGEYCLLVRPGDVAALDMDTGTATVPPGSKEDMVFLIKTAFLKRGLMCAGCIHLWNLDAPDIDVAKLEELNVFKLTGAYSLVALANAISETGITGRMWIVTSGTQAVSASSGVSFPAGAPAWGLGRVLWYQELVGNKGKLIDLDPASSAQDAEENARQIMNEITNPACDDEVAYRGGRRYISRMNRSRHLIKPLSVKLRGDGCYLVTGAYGAIGQLLCRMLIKNGARRLILFSRSEVPPRQEWNDIDSGSASGKIIAFIKELESMGADIITWSVDMTNEDQLTNAIINFKQLQYPPVRGIFQAAGVVKDTIISGMDIDTFNKVYDPKVSGGYLLHKYFKNEPVEHFVLFSSIASLVTTAGQTNYAAGNAFLDSLAFYRRSRGLPAMAVNWGPWAVGMIKKLNLIHHYKVNRGMMSIPGEAGAALFDRILGQNLAQVIVAADVDWPVFLSWYPIPLPMIENLIEVRDDGKKEEGEKFIDKFRNTDENFRETLVQEHLIDLIADTLHTKQSRVTPEISLNKLGLDSILAIDLRNRIVNDFGYALTVVNLLSGSPISRIAEQIHTGLSQMLEEAAGGEEETPAEICTDPNEYPLTYGQKAIWFLNQLNPDSPAYNIAGAIEMPLAVDVEKFRRALKEFVMRHPSLRANFFIRDGKPVQRIAPVAREDFKVIDVTGRDRETVHRMLVTEYKKPFSLETDSLIRFRLFRQAEDNYILMYNVYHIISDATSAFVAFDEILSLYDSHVKNQTPQLPAVTSTYFDFCNWQSKFLAGKKARQIFNYWKNHLPEEIPLLDLPTDKPRPVVQTNNGDSCFFQLNTDLSKRIHEIAQATDTTVFMILLSAYYILMHKYSGQEDIIIGTPVKGRTSEEFARVYGYFMNPLPLHASFKGDPVCRDFLKQIQDVVLNGLDNQEYPFALLVEKLKQSHDASRSAIFQVMFLLLVHRVENTEEKYGYKVNYMELSEEEGQFDLLLSAFEDQEEGCFHCVLKYNTDLFFKETIERMTRHYITLLEEMTGNINKRITEYNMLTAAEKQLLLGTWSRKSNTGVEVTVPIHELIGDTAVRNEAKIAVAVPFEKQATVYLTYGELNRAANRMARFLRDKGVKNNVIVGICLEKSAEMIISVLAVLKAGGAYLPIDPKYPEDRISHMLKDSGVNILITHSEIDVPVNASIRNIIHVDKDTAGLAGYEDSNPENINQLSDLAYVIYTSASTGLPKGAMISHYNIASVYASYRRDYDLEHVTNHLQISSFSFDIFAGDFTRTLCSGGKLILCRHEIVLNIPCFYKVMVEEQAHCGDFVPATIRTLVMYLENSGKRLDFMKHFIVGAEAWKKGEYEKLRSFCSGDVRIIHTYGLTEAAVDNTYFEGDVGDFAAEQNLPIGKPIYNSTAYILDGNRMPVPVGIPGELYIGGQGVGCGYINNEQLTAERFVIHSFYGAAPVRLYKTGDIVMWDNTGNIVMKGRADNQVKVRGLRIELGEIERRILQYPDIKSTIVIARADRGEEKILYCYYISGSGKEIAVKALQNWIGDKLPPFMIPSYFMALAQFPLNPNGKIDLAALPGPDAAGEDDAAGIPRTLYEVKVAKIWQKLFGVDKVGLHHNFFEIGGSSIKMIELILYLQQEFNITIAVGQLYKCSTLAAMARTVEDIVTGKVEGAEPYVVFNTSGDRTVHVFPPAGGYGLIYEPFAALMPEYKLVCFNYLTEENKVVRYADMVLELQPEGPYTLFGYSLGGNMAFEAGKELEARGCTVADIIIIDSYRILETFSTDEQELAAFRKELAQHLKNHTGSDIVEEHTFAQAKDYIEFFSRNLNPGSVSARVSVITSARTPDGHNASSQYKVSLADSWQESSRTEISIYQGSGEHVEMLLPGFMERNAQIIRQIVCEVRLTK